MSEVSVNEVLKQFESVFGKMPAVRATNGEKTYERGDMKLLEMPPRVMHITPGLCPTPKGKK